MSPFEPVSEFAQKRRRRDGSTLAPRDIGEVSEVAFELLGVIFGERKLPGAVVGASARGDELARQVVVIAHDAGVMCAEGDDTSAGESGDVDHRSWCEALGV